MTGGTGTTEDTRATGGIEVTVRSGWRDEELPARAEPWALEEEEDEEDWDDDEWDDEDEDEEWEEEDEDDEEEEEEEYWERW